MRIRPRSASAARPGVSLLEMAAVIWLDVILLMVGMAALMGALKLEQSAAGSLQRGKGLGMVADQFRADVSQAVAAPERLDDLKASPTCLILRRTDGKHVAYRWDNGRLERAEPAGAGASWQPLPRLPTFSAGGFTRSGRLIALRLSEARGPSGMTRPVEVVAALGGDLQ